jgi:plastocyanin
MTLFYNEEQDAIIENHPDEWVEFDDEGRMLFDMADSQKRDSMHHAAESAQEAHEPPVDRGDKVTFVDTDGTEYDAVVTEVWGEDTINVAYAADGELSHATSVTGETPESEGYYWFA